MKNGFTHLNAWRRFAAKMVDVSIANVFLGILIILLVFTLEFLDYNIFIPELNEDKIKFLDKYIGLAISICLLIPLQYKVFKNTFGKFLFGIVIQKLDGKYLSFQESMKREGKVFINGFLFSWISIIYQYFAFKKKWLFIVG